MTLLTTYVNLFLYFSISLSLNCLNNKKKIVEWNSYKEKYIEGFLDVSFKRVFHIRIYVYKNLIHIDINIVGGLKRYWFSEKV